MVRQKRLMFTRVFGVHAVHGEEQVNVRARISSTAAAGLRLAFLWLMPAVHYNAEAMAASGSCRSQNSQQGCSPRAPLKPAAIERGGVAIRDAVRYARWVQWR